MPSRRQLWLLLPKQLRELPADLAAVLAVVALTNVVAFAPVINETPLRIVVGLVVVLFVPGYAFVAALFPEAGEPPSTDASEPSAFGDRGIDGIERIALSFGLSIAIVPLIGLVLNFTPFGIRLVPIVLGVSLFVVVTTAVAAVRRWALPANERFCVPYRQWIAAGRTELFEPDSQVDVVLNVVFVLAILLAASSVAYAVAVPSSGEQFSEFYVLGEDDDGELVADNYPETLVVDEPASIHVAIANNEFDTVDYTVVVQLQVIEGDGNESQVVDRTELSRFSTTVGHNETWIDERELVAPPDDAFLGEERRLMFLLYTDDVPESPERENAYRDLHLWVEVVGE